MSEVQPPTLRGQITGDPFQGLPVGHEHTLEPVVVGHTDGRTVPDGVTNWTFFEGALAMVAVSDGVTASVDGTAVMIAPGLAMTATHVVEPHLAAIRDSRIGLLLVAPRTQSVDFWRVRSVSYSESDDFAFLSLELASALPPDWRFMTMPLTTRAPTAGEALRIFGFRYQDVVLGCAHLIWPHLGG